MAFKKYISRHSKKPLTISNFIEVISWESIKIEMYAKDYKKFCKWMNGQTTTYGGVYKCDLERFLNGLDCID